MFVQAVKLSASGEREKGGESVSQQTRTKAVDGMCGALSVLDKPNS